ncbi:MAG: class I SAM-dependent methyltransferase [Acidimicrobiales bacterium]
MRDGQRSAGQYDAMAVAYAADNAVSAYNAYYERPATISLLGDVDGRRVLEVGCGAGPLTEWLVDQGALVTALDVSPAMVQLAQDRLGGRATFLMADAADRLPFAPNATFDLVVASLVLHYVRDWECPLSEFRRMLTPRGAVVFSTHHPTMDGALHSPDDYFAVKQVTETWSKGSGDFDVTFWRRPLTAMTSAIASAGFVIEHLIEPQPSGALRERDPDAYELLSTKPRFLLFRLRPRLHDP